VQEDFDRERHPRPDGVSGGDVLLDDDLAEDALRHCHEPGQEIGILEPLEQHAVLRRQADGCRFEVLAKTFEFAEIALVNAAAKAQQWPE
jgi:hypothetical protein